jgi:signal transduction histidine kinase/ligand-binding sensor domain-containing protein/ActR/RegA family two-component response regulator
MYGADVGLTNLTILALHQDHDGFLWVSTEGGLFRYDGDRFQHFSGDPIATRGDTRSLYSSPDGQFWIASSVGLYRWTGEHFAAVPGFEGVDLESGQAIGSDAMRLYVATRAGLRSLPLRGGGQTRLLSPKSSSSVYVAPDETIWFSCGSVICSLREGREREWASQAGVTPGHWSSIAEDAAGRLWIRSNDKVLVRESPGAAFHTPPNLPPLNSTHGALLAPTRLGQMLIPYAAGLIACEGDDCRKYGVESGLRHTDVITALEDREGLIWIGYSGHGLARWLGCDQWQGFAEDEGLADTGIWRMVRDRAGDLWIGTSHGLFWGTRQGGGWRFRRSDAAGELTVYGLAAETDGSLWVGTFQSQTHGLLRYYPQTRQKVIYPPAQPFPQFATYEIHRAASGTIWVSTPRGVMRLKPGSARLEAVPLPLDGASVFDIKTTGNSLLVASKKGLYIQQGEMRRLLTKAEGLKDNSIQSVVIGPDGALWVDYFSSAGITRVDLQGGRVHLQHFTMEDGLPSNVVYSQFFDARQRHWVATDSGVAVYEGNRWKHYDTSDGLIWDDCNAHAYLADADGTVWIGTSAGLSRFQPVAQPKSILPATLITAVLRNDMATQNTDFDSSMHTLGLRFTMLSYRRHNPTFRYRIGTETDPWVQTQAREVRFAEFPAGSYRFEVQGEVEPGVWSRPALLEFRIRAPWFLSWPFRVSLLFLLVGIIWLGWQRREAGQRKVRAELEVAVEERTRDLTAARARAEQASRVKSEFVANISHEMRTPLNAVIGFTHLALQLAAQPEVAEYLRNVDLSAKGLLSLINDVLDFSKMESGRVEIVPEAFALRPFITDVLSILRQEASRKRVALNTVIEESTPAWVVADPGRLRQVLVNLLGNALKFTSRGAVTLQVAHTANQLKFAVRDTGIGIPLEKQGTIFEAFQQADNSTSRRYGGTGLGLTISKKLVESMGGELMLASEPGKGSTFWFTIDAPAASAPPPVAQPLEETPTRPMRILVAEDNRVNQHLILALLRKRGHTTALAGNGAEALAAIERDSFDLVLMDIQMPEMDGLEAVRRIRKVEATTGLHLTVVAMTARAMAGDREAILAAGMDDYLEKPIQMERLDAVLRAVSNAGPWGPSGRAVSGEPAGPREAHP